MDQYERTKECQNCLPIRMMSERDSVVPVRDFVQTGKNAGVHKALAITDHGVCAGLSRMQIMKWDPKEEFNYALWCSKPYLVR